MKTKPKSKRVTKMNSDELARATGEFDREFVADSFGAPDEKAKKRLARAKKKRRGRPIRGLGAKVISLSVERGLLERSDALAKKLKMSRAKLIELGLLKLIEEKTPRRD